MHVVHPHLPRAVIVSFGAALATIVIMLALAARLGDVQLGQSQASSPARQTVAHTVPQLTARLSAPAAPRTAAWLSNPFMPLVPTRSPRAGRQPAAEGERPWRGP